MSVDLISVKYIIRNDIRALDEYYKVSQERWKDAVACYHKGEYFTCTYLAGYSAECLLKHVILERNFALQFASDKLLNVGQICRVDKCYEPLKKHSLDGLINLGNEKNVFKGVKEGDYLEIVHWTSEWRYALQHNITKEKAEQYLQAVIRMTESLKRELSGVVKIQSFKLIEDEVAEYVSINS